MASLNLSVQPISNASSVISGSAGSTVRSSRSCSCVSLCSSPKNLRVSSCLPHRQWQVKTLVSWDLSRGRMSKNARSYQVPCSSLPAEGNEEEETAETEVLQDLRVPQAWADPEVAAREAEWLRVALHQWLDDEFCPEPANEEISKRCSKAFYYCLLEQQLDVGDILMQMVRGLETLSFKDSFHGVFSSANAAIDLITKRMRSISLEDKDTTLDSTAV